MSAPQILPKILCVDDEANILSSLERLLRGKFEVFTSTSPLKALEILRQNSNFAVVLSDFRMPEMNGIEFLRQIKTLYPETSRAILSGQIDMRQVADALNAHDIHKFFLKPWENEYLELQMLEAVQIHRTLRDKAHFELLSITDPVTQLTNHRYFQDQLRRLIELCKSNGRALGLVIFDVDHFKSFNDRFGHPEGDRLLFNISSQLKNDVADRGIVSRYGGEEFTLIMPLLTTGPKALEEIKSKAEQIRLHIEKAPFSGLTSNVIFTTISGGVAVFPDHGLDASTLIERADQALYVAKNKGRNQIALAEKK